MVVSDLHQIARLYILLQEAVRHHEPDILVINGDYLDIPAGGSGQLSVQGCARKLDELPVREIVITRGNHEGEAIWEFADEFTKSGRRLVTLHGEAFVYGTVTIVGFPCFLGNHEPFSFDKRPIPPSPEGWLPRLLRKFGPAARMLWVAHEPPLGTHPCPEWREAIAEYQPWVFVSGHDHKSALKSGKWYQRVGQTVCVGLGQSDGDKLHYSLVEMEFASSKPSLPRRLKIGAFP